MNCDNCVVSPNLDTCHCPRVSELQSRLDAETRRADGNLKTMLEMHALAKGYESRLDKAVEGLEEIATHNVSVSSSVARWTLKQIAVERRDPKLLEDGFGMSVRKCDRDDCDLQIVRPGKVACGKCDNAELFEKGVLGADERYVRQAKE